MQELKRDGARVSITAHETCWRPLETDKQTTGHGTLERDLREVIEKAATPDILYCEKVKKTWRPLETDEPTTEKVKKTDAETQTPDKPPAPKKLKKSIKLKKPVKLNTDFNNIN